MDEDAAARGRILADGAEGESHPPEHRRGSRGKRAGLVVLVLVLAAGAGVGGYLVGERGGEDLDAARAAGERQGKRENAARGAKLGYREGLEMGRRAGYEQAHRKAYVRAYRKQFEDAGLAVPEEVKVP